MISDVSRGTREFVEFKIFSDNNANVVHVCYLSMLKTIHKANATVRVFARLVTNQKMEQIMLALL